MSREQVWFRLLTAPGPAAIAQVRLEGPGADALLAAHVAEDVAELPRRAGVRELRDPEGSLVDEVLAARDPEGGWTLGLHGGAGVVAAVRALFLRSGAIEGPAPQRAEGRCEAEARRLLPSARTRLAAQVLLRQAAGALRGELEAILGELAQAEPGAARARLARLLASAELGRRLLVPAKVALWGLPNAGKSSLLNALLGRERVLVAARPGTTRDAIGVELDLDGLPAEVIDTAGQRESEDALEAEGVALARREGRDADLRLVVVDGCDDARPPEPPAPALWVWSKADRPEFAPPADSLVVSARDGFGLSELRAALRAQLLGAARAIDPSGPVVFAPRQAGLVAGALRALEAGERARAERCLRAVTG